MLQKIMRYVIIGNGPAGDAAAVKIRELDPGGSIDVFTRENVPFYYRPRLVDYLAGEVTIEKFTFHNEQWYADRNIRLHLSTEVTAVSPAEKSITTSDGKSYPYDRLLLSMGGYCFKPPITGIENVGDLIFTLRDKADSDGILLRAKSTKTVILIGGGLLGLETGNSLRKLGLALKVVEFFPRLLPRQLDNEGAKLLEKTLSSMGFEFYLGEVSERVEKHKVGLKLQLKSGIALEGDFMIISAGIRCEMKLASGAAIKTGKGIIIDDYMRTSIEDIYAAGDVSEHRGVLYGIWPPAQEQGAIAGANMAGQEVQYQGTAPSYRLKVVGINLVSTGEIDVDGKYDSRVLLREQEGIYKKAVLEQGKVIGAIMLGNIEGEREIVKAIKEGKPFTEVERFFEGHKTYA